ncbi:MAG TPA: F0F1 ATP synthase subunit B [Spirochaetota bacterium]|nr:F0F1 ATP synthase subunit B [Spirochaetota bacterium]HPI90003.1 F0F1 ATP synthase subunit B [Spirochaetota bacterium]HPR47273.1 F0F1 ATP synthase subunit B [Spirochaetota bacterium]
MAIIKEGLLKVDPGLLLWTIITFAVLVLLLWKTAWRPIVDALDARAEKVRGDIENAEKAREEAEKVLNAHRQEMAKAKDDAAEIISKGREEAEKIKNEIVEKANKEASMVVERARKEVDLAKENALAEIKNEVVLLSTEIASKIISKNINPDDQKALVQEALNKMRTVQ